MRNNESGFTLIEVVIAAVVLFVVIGIAVGFCSSMLTASGGQFRKVSLEESLNRAMSEVVRLYGESSSSLCAVEKYGALTCVVFPTARRKNGSFAAYEVNGDGEIVSISTAPQWQGWVVLYVNSDRELVVYHDYREGHVWSAPVFPYSDDFTDNSTAVFYYRDGAKEDGEAVDWELPKDYRKVREYGEVTAKVLARNVDHFVVEKVSAGIRVYLMGREGVGDRHITVRYNDSTTGRNNN